MKKADRRVPLLSKGQRTLLTSFAAYLASPRMGAVNIPAAKAITTALDEIDEHRKLNRNRVARARKRPLKLPGAG